MGTSRLIAVLGIQGGIEEHIAALRTIPGIRAIATIKPHELAAADGIILPGGESTAIGKLLADFDLVPIIQDKARSGTPVWGTCAGAILLANKLDNDHLTHLGLMDIVVTRNAYGSQANSFVEYAELPFLGAKPFPLVFIRAPVITEAGQGTEILATRGKEIIACRSANLIATTFHPELTEDSRFHAWFAEIVKAGQVR